MPTLSSVPEVRELVRGIIGDIPNHIFNYLEIGQDIRTEWRKGDKASNFGGHTGYLNNYEERIIKLINQQIKSVLDELEGEVIGGDESSGIFPEIGESSTIRDNLRAEQRDAIQKIRSRYE